MIGKVIRRGLLVVTLSLIHTSTAEAVLITSQSFELAGDTWNFTPSPTRYNTEGDEQVAGSEDVWSEIQSFDVFPDPPFVADTGDRFWGMQDLVNGNGGGNFDHVLMFENIDISRFSDVMLSFAYNVIGYDNGEFLGYELFFDGNSQGPTTAFAGGNPPTNGADSNGWVTQTIAIPDSVDQVRLNLTAFQNGSGDLAGWDSVSLQSAPVVNHVPEPSSLAMLAILTLFGMLYMLTSRARSVS